MKKKKREDDDTSKSITMHEVRSIEEAGDKASSWVTQQDSHEGYQEES